MVEKEAYDVFKLNNKLLVKTLVFVLVLVIGMIGTFSAYAMNLDYLQPSKWDNAENITSIALNKRSTNRILDGVMKYYIDEKEGCLYVVFFVNETSLDVSKDDVRMRFNISGDHSSYFTVNKDGIVDCEKEPDFSVYQSFNTYNDYEYTGVYISALDFGKVKYDTSVKISFYVNGRIYTDIKTIIVPPTKATTTKSSKTTTQRSAKDKLVNSNEKSSKVSTERSTKFSPSGTVSGRVTQNKNSASSYSYVKSADTTNSIQKEGVTTAPSREEQTADEAVVRGQLTQQSKNIINVAVIIAFIGLCFLIASAFMSPDKKPEDKDNNEKSETVEK